MQGLFRVVNSDQTLAALLQEAKDLYALRRWYMCQFTTDKQRTRLQNNSLHLWLDMICRELNDKGMDVQQVLEKAVEREWSMPAAKELLFKPIMKAHTGKDSTTKLSTKECVDISDILNRHLGEHFGVSVQWPCKENRLSADRGKHG